MDFSKHPLDNLDIFGVKRFCDGNGIWNEYYRIHVSID